MTTALWLGAVFGAGLVAAARLLWPRPVPLHAALARLEAHPARPHGSPGDTATARLGRWAQTGLEAAGVDLGGLAPDLRITARSTQQHLGAKALLGLLGISLPPATAALAALGGARPGISGILLFSVAAGAAGFLLPDVLLRAEASRRRRDFLTALGSYLDLVVISLAGGAGVEAALRNGAQVGQGWVFAELRAALDAAHLTGTSPWDAMARLGQDLRVGALVELAATVSLAGVEGARVRDSLGAKASALRARQLSDAEADAQAATERMAVPTVLLLTGFMILIGYPALDAVLTGL